MKKEKVRCWELKVKNETSVDVLYITYPEGSLGYKLICCLNCGEVFAVNLTKELYVGPSLNEKLKNFKCTVCGVALYNFYGEYPEKYVSSDGNIYNYTRDIMIPQNEASITKEFLEIYSD